MQVFTPKTQTIIKYLVMVLCLITTVVGFGHSHAFAQLSYGIALFLFGMQCIEDGLQAGTGGTVERLMASGTKTPFKGLLFGMFSTFILQSSTLVSLLTIAFLGTGLITLAGGISIILGTNLGATSGIWLLALLGKNISLSVFATPIFVLGVLASFFKGKTKSIGRVFIGIALIFIGIETLQKGFGTLGNDMDFSRVQTDGLLNILTFSLIGFIITILLQSTHAALILTLASLSAGQINVDQSFAIALGSNVGSSVVTAFVGILESSRDGKRLAIVHVLFNIVTALLALMIWIPLVSVVKAIAAEFSMNSLLQLALFHTLFNVLGVSLFWPIQSRLSEMLYQWLPEKKEPSSRIGKEFTSIKAKYLTPNMLCSGDSAVRAVHLETQHLMRVCIEELCHAFYIKPDTVYQFDNPQVSTLTDQQLLVADAKAFYDTQVKELYAQIVYFTSQLQTNNPRDEDHLFQLNVLGSLIVDIGKEAKKSTKKIWLRICLYLQVLLMD
ncbi:Na/Pi cotransporter family protein [Pelistega indica]|uniref:Na/Pi cotransporter family protein n=1 Tax=Pelistega indica TaxID=1414851 RepID=UPI0004123778|nr:Na/Pi symporter [Pelistega indica]